MKLLFKKSYMLLIVFVMILSFCTSNAYAAISDFQLMPEFDGNFSKISDVKILNVNSYIVGGTIADIASPYLERSAGYTMISRWFNNSDAVYMEEDSVFRSDKVYCIDVVLTPKQGFFFDKPENITVEIEGISSDYYKVDSVKSTGDATQIWFGIYFNKPSEPKLEIINDIKILNVRRPADGEIIPDDIKAPDNAGYEIRDIDWVDLTDSIGKSEGKDVFRAGQEYMLKISLRSKDGYEFNEPENLTAEAVGLDGYYRTLITTHEVGRMILIYFDRKNESPEMINDIKILNVKRPVDGEIMPNDIKAPDDAGYEVRDIDWCDLTDSVIGNAGEDVFRAGNKYMLKISFQQKSGYEFNTPDKLTADIVSLDGAYETVIKNHSVDGCRFVMIYFNEPQTESPTRFTDVKQTDWYGNDVRIAYEKGLINGKSADAFAPYDNMTYAEAVKLAACMNQLYYDGKISLEAGTEIWYSTYMKYCLDNDIIETDLTSKSNDKITRREFVKIFYASLPPSEFTKKNSVADNSIPDVKAADKYSEEIYTFYRAGILAGSDKLGTFNPESNIIRAEVAAILTRMFDITARVAVALN